MYEADGLKVLKKFFSNQIDQLIDNLIITDKIQIKGLEQFEDTVEEQKQSEADHKQSDARQNEKNQ